MGRTCWPHKGGAKHNILHGAREDASHIPEHAATEAGISPDKVPRLSMRQLLLRIAGPFPHFAPGPIPHIRDAAPEEVNCFTDGGICFKSKGPSALPGWGGVYRGDVELQQDALINQSAWNDMANGELRFWGQLDGQALSSTRVEGWAVIGAHLLPRPIHLGIDNAAAPFTS